MIYLYYSDRFLNYNFGPEHPLNPTRLSLSYKLMEDSGLIDDKMEVLEPEPASEEELRLVHTLEYIEAVRLEEPDLAFGLGSDDTPVFPGIFDASRTMAGGSIDAAKRIVAEDCSAFNIAGGLHHAFPTQAAGFCVFNDVALAISILKERFSRILYIDIDAHHGDGVQQIFYEDPNVLTFSIHESGDYLFPGTGFVDEAGYGPGLGYCVNLPMPMYASDQDFRLAFEEVVPRLFDWFKPQVVVAELGVDTHYSDPLTSLNLTLRGYARMVRRIVELTGIYAERRLLALGGGGYSLQVVPPAWTAALHLMRGEEPTEYLPPYWVELFSNVVGYVPLSYPDIDLPIGTETEKRVSLELASTIKRLKGVHSRISPELF
ncbi:acetoin utilization protein AcuC [Candidatus Methanocrinis natronophilus]|uniref:Acetoin utilization protein AcuC n=1 Tax=Candidatus Methanocrinis natronophilus TaxID=3033396 RepID=A0ABT5X4X3_9EURY|nr:acetoin utilization protein AcuC [Candidatus Methanocrinis natronophilus]MDF0589736.1 acetoin utilization protein AcuC [Candidatus Methanocrinis natronophilus]